MNDQDREALLDVVAALAGAASAYRTYAKRHASHGKAETDPFFSTRIKDMDAAVERGRAAIAKGATHSDLRRVFHAGTLAAGYAGGRVRQLSTTSARLIEELALRVGMKSLMNNGAASCVYSEGCEGVSQEHLIAFAEQVALHCVASLYTPPTASDKRD